MGLGFGFGSVTSSSTACLGSCGLSSTRCSALGLALAGGGAPLRWRKASHAKVSSAAPCDAASAARVSSAEPVLRAGAGGWAGAVAVARAGAGAGARVRVRVRVKVRIRLGVKG